MDCIQPTNYIALGIVLWASLAAASFNDSSGVISTLQERVQSNGICRTYAVEAGETCSSIAKKFGLTAAHIEQYSANTYRWPGCSGILPQGIFICLGPGQPPMPVALPHATCGPQVPGTTRPSNFADLPFLNPCHSDKCVSDLPWMICLITPSINHWLCSARVKENAARLLASV